jgi:WD40 repeat protein
MDIDQDQQTSLSTTTTTAQSVASASSSVPQPPTQQQQQQPQQTTPGASLVETQVFVPQTKSIGTGKDALRYTPQSPAWCCTFSPNGEWLAACFGAPMPYIRIWRQDQQTEGWAVHSTLDGIHERTIRCVAFCPLSSSCVLAAASFDGTVTIWEHNHQKPSDAWECTTQLEGHENEVKFVCWNGTGSLLASCGRDKTVWLWETFLDGTVGGTTENEFECVAVLNGHEGDVKCVQFAPSHGIWGDGDEIALSASYDDTIKVWAEDDGDWYCACSIQDVHRDTIWSLAVAPGGGRLVSGSADGSLAILKSYTPTERKEKFPDLGDGANGLWKCVGVLEGAHSSTVYCVAYAPARAGHGRIASSGGDNRIQIYREVSGSTSDQPLFTVDVAVDTTHGDVNCVCWHPRDGSILCSAGDDGTVRIWRFEL